MLGLGNPAKKYILDINYIHNIFLQIIIQSHPIVESMYGMPNILALTRFAGVEEYWCRKIHNYINSTVDLIKALKMVKLFKPDILNYLRIQNHGYWTSNISLI